MNIYEKAGDLLIDLAKLIFGGVILASIISESINTLALYIIGSIIIIAFICVGFLLYKLKVKNKQ
jgi:hypothetical protein